MRLRGSFCNLLRPYVINERDQYIHKRLLSARRHAGRSPARRNRQSGFASEASRAVRFEQDCKTLRVDHSRYKVALTTRGLGRQGSLAFNPYPQVRGLGVTNGEI
jgi:hypothetical protein